MKTLVIFGNDANNNFKRVEQSLVALHLLCLSFSLFLLALAGGLLLLSHVVPQNSHFFVVVLVEVEPETMAQPYLEKIVV